MPNTLTLEPKHSILENSILEPTGSPLFKESTDSDEITDSSDFSPLVLGAPFVDEMLERFRVPRGSLVYLDCVPEVAPYGVLFALARAALLCGKRVTFLTVPMQNPYVADANDMGADLQSGRRIWPHLSRWLSEFGLLPYVNAAVPSDPEAPLRFLPTNSITELDRVVTALLTYAEEAQDGQPDWDVQLGSYGKPDLILLYGLEYLFPIELFANLGWALSEETVQEIQDAHQRMREWLQKAQDLCLQSETPLVMTRTNETFHALHDTPPTLLTRTLPTVFAANCRYSLVAHAPISPTCCDACPPGLPLTLLEFDHVLGQEVARISQYADLANLGAGPFIEEDSTPTCLEISSDS